MATFPKIASLRRAADLRSHLSALGLDLPCDDEVLAAPDSPLAQELSLGKLGGEQRVCANRFVIHPMEGWDGTADGRPSDLTVRRWQNFGRSGASLIWGGEAVAVRRDGRANPHQLVIDDDTASDIGRLRRELLEAAAAAGQAPPVIGLQLTHSGRWSRVATGEGKSAPAPRAAFRHPVLDPRAGVTGDAEMLDDREVDDLITCFAHAAYLAQEEGFEFVDVKHCHGYLLHEFLSARDRPGNWGGAELDQRARLMDAMIAAVRAAAPRIGIAMRLSIFDIVPHHADGRDAAGKLGPGVPDVVELPYRFGFGVDREEPTRLDLREPIEIVRRLVQQGVRLINITAGSPYYCPHVQRPAAFPPSDGYAPPEDPLAGVARLLRAARSIKSSVPEAIVVSTGWSYLQEYIPHVAQACVRAGWFDAVGLGRMVLAYPELPADVLAGRQLARKRICRTFSDCTTAPRMGLVSGCYPLDNIYRTRPEYEELERRKRQVR